MSDPLLHAFEAFPPPDDKDYNNEITLSPPPIDPFSFNSVDILAPHPDLFESELDSSLAAFNESDIQLQLLTTVDNHDPFAFLRSDTPTHQYRSNGPPSNLTLSSDAFSQDPYESLSAYSESLYNSKSNYSLPIDMDFSRIRVDQGDYGRQTGTTPSPALSSALSDEASFGTLPSADRSSPANGANTSYTRSAAYSDYARSPPVVRSSAASDYYPHLRNAYNTHASHGSSGVAPHNVSSGRHQHSPPNELPLVPAIPPLPLVRSFRDVRDDMNNDDPRRKYKCPNCPRAFARAYNLKTHMSTHDPNRPKPHVCPHKSCGRSFSRKHDLGRHLVSIHREDSNSVYSNGSAGSARLSANGVGVEKGPRGWCDSCGKGWVGRDYGCECRDES